MQVFVACMIWMYFPQVYFPIMMNHCHPDITCVDVHNVFFTVYPCKKFWYIIFNCIVMQFFNFFSKPFINVQYTVSALVINFPIPKELLLSRRRLYKSEKSIQSKIFNLNLFELSIYTHLSRTIPSCHVIVRINVFQIKNMETY